MKYARFTLALTIVWVMGISTVAQNTNPDISKDAQRIRKHVVEYGFGHRIRVKLKGGPKHHGTVGLLDDVSFQVRDVDMGKVVTIKYEDVQKVQGDYEEINIFGTRPNPKTSKIILFGGLVGVVALIALMIPKT